MSETNLYSGNGIEGHDIVNRKVTSPFNVSVLATRPQLQIAFNKTYQTWIDDGLIVDGENYPTYSNIKNFFVLEPKDKIMNSCFLA